MKAANLVAGIFTVVFGIAVYWLTLGFATQGLSPDPLGPTFFPRALGIGFVVLGLILVIAALRQKGGEKRTEPILSRGNLRMLAVIGLCALYYLFMDDIGFILATILFVAAVMVITGERTWWKMGVSALAVSLILYFLFREILKVMLPIGFGS